MSLPHTPAGGVFVAGTDTGVGKTLVACALLHAFAAAGKSAVGMKPVATGCEMSEAGMRCEDVIRLQQASTLLPPPDLVNPYALALPVSPHIAAAKTGRSIDLEQIRRAHDRLRGLADEIVVEGVGGFRVPLNEREDTADLARMLGLPVVLVVGMRLGCLNHALLTAEAVIARGLRLAGWVANRIDPEMTCFEANLESLQRRIPSPLLGVVPYSRQPDAVAVARMLHFPAAGEPGFRMP